MATDDSSDQAPLVLWPCCSQRILIDDIVAHDHKLGEVALYLSPHGRLPILAVYIQSGAVHMDLSLLHLKKPGPLNLYVGSSAALKDPTAHLDYLICGGASDTIGLILRAC